MMAGEIYTLRKIKEKKELVVEQPPQQDVYNLPAIPRNFLRETNDRFRRPHVSSLNSGLADYLGYRPVDTPWEHIGIASTVDETDDTLLQLYKRAIDPYREWYEYRVVDKRGVVIPLGTKTTYLEDGDSIGTIVGMESKGEFKVHIFDEFKYVYI